MDRSGLYANYVLPQTKKKLEKKIKGGICSVMKNIPAKVISPEKNKKENIDALILPDVNPNEVVDIRESCRRIGIGIDDYLGAIKRALESKKMTVDKFGDEHWEDNHDVQLKAALAGLKLEGYIDVKNAAGVDARRYTQINVSWGNDREVGGK